MDVSTLVASISGAAELAKLLVNERDRQKAAAIESQLTDKITQAQIQLSQVLGAVIEKDGRIQGTNCTCGSCNAKVQIKPADPIAIPRLINQPTPRW